jgi:tRNA nucleotidyltransferase (CCA-adding enzyme)
MKVYLVGGAVRDALLNLPVVERDWVVVGASANELLAQKFRQVGKDFPVFLHPKTNEEYALARTEKKSSPGYYGFSCQFDPSVTLEQDLARRDLTINAMAIDEHGQIVDPYQGQVDLSNKILRHVSDAFIEDPVRVLRAARFAARFHHLGFRLAKETKALMYAMVKSGELNHLVAERVWQEWHKSLQEENPEQFIWTLRGCNALSVLFPELDTLFGIPNTYHHHHEIDSGIHTLMVLQEAVKLSTDASIRFAALVHDLGKGLTPNKHWPRHHGHEERGVELIVQMCQRMRIPNDFTALAKLGSRFHLMIHRLFELRNETIVEVLERCDAFRKPAQFQSLLKVCEADFLGRKGIVGPYRQGALWKSIWEVCATIDAKEIVAQGYQGSAIKLEVFKKRIAGVKLLRPTWGKHEE